jgi:hypothetical protein
MVKSLYTATDNRVAALWLEYSIHCRYSATDRLSIPMLSGKDLVSSPNSADLRYMGFDARLAQCDIHW